MTDASTPAIGRRLIEKWRKQASDRGYEPYAQWAFNRCADELDAALRACADALAPAPLDPMVEAQLQKEIAGALKERREIYDQAPATDGSEQGRWSYLAQCNASHLADLVQRLSTLRGAPEPKWLTRDDCIALENLCTAKARAVQESSPDDADEFRRLMQKVLRLRADALAPPSTESDDLAHDAKVQAVHLRLTQRANEVHSAHVALEEAAEEIVDLQDQLADALAPPEPKYATDEQVKASAARMIERHRPSLEKLAAPPRADALAAVPTERPFLASVLEALVDPERTDFELRQLDLGRDRPVWLAALRRELAPLLGGPQ